MTILANAVLVELNISTWTAYKLDKQQSAKIVADNNATESDAARVNKNLMAGTSLLKNINDYVAKVRVWHIAQTLPWAEKGPRLLPMKNFFAYKQQLNQMEGNVSALVRTFVDAYPNLVSVAAFKTGGFFNRDDYPSVDEVSRKFSFRYAFTPVPQAGHFILDTHNEVMQELATNYEAEANRRIGEAMKDAWGRLHETLKHLSDRMTDAPAEQEDKKKRYHDSMLTNAHELCALLTAFNITSDPNLEQARQDLERTLSGVRIDDIKESASVRKEIKTKVDSIISSYEWL
jgi:hypothetical protein